MKKYILFILSCLLAFTACDDFLEETPKTKYPLSEYFNDEEETMLYLYGCYYKVKTAVFGTEFMYLTDTMTDDIDYTSTNINRKGVAYLTLSTTNTLVKTMWGRFYAIIEQCNILIDQIEANPELSPANSDAIIAEAKFMRAWAYFNLVQLWGDVPLLTKPVYNINKDNIVPFRTSKEEIYSFLINDLEWVATIVEDTPGKVTVRSGVSYNFTISRAAAKTLLGKVYQVCGQWEDVIETLSYFTNGEDLNPNFGLCEHFNYIFDSRYKSIPERSKEVLWEMVASAETDLNNTWHREVAPSELSGPSGEKLIGNSKGYQSYIPTYDLFNLYSSSDLRYLEGFQISSALRPQFMKGYDVETLNQNLGGSNVILLRTADSYLTLAEAYARLGNSQKAIQLTNVVRQRAKIGDLDAGLSGESLIDAILLERRLEFAGEGAYRLYDLRRTGKYLETMQKFNENLTELAGESKTQIFINPASGKKTPAISVPFLTTAKIAYEKHLLLPIPQDERISNKNLTQNNGWN